MANSFYDRFKEATQKVKVKSKKTERSFNEQFKLVFWCGMVAAAFIHVISFVSAVAYPAYHFQVIFGSSILGVIIGGILVGCLVEIPKYTFFSVYFENKFNTGINSYGMLAAATFFVLVSAFLSPSGIGHIVEWLTPEAKVIDTEAKENDYSSERASIVALWEPKIKSLKKEHKDWYESQKKFYPKENKGKGRYRLPNARSLINKEKGFLSSIEKMENTLAKEIGQLSDLKTNVVTSLLVENKGIKKSHQEKKEAADLFSFVLMLILETTYIVAIWGMKYYNHRSEKEQPKEENEQEEQVETQTEQKEQPKQQPNRTKQEGTGDNKGDSPSPSMQIPYKNQTEPNKQSGIIHGSISPPEQNQTEPRINYKNKKGQFNQYTQKELMAMSRRKAGSDKWKKELIGMANRLDKYKNR